MGSNIEIKARVSDLERLQPLIEELSGGPPQRISQEDVFFHSQSGRLKLRILDPDRGELIFYEREDSDGPARSDYLICPVGDPLPLKTLLTASLGLRGIVRKQRRLYTVGNTRIHLDRVESLGDFVEVEVVLNPGQSEEDGRAIAIRLIEQLGVAGSDLVDVAYIDLIQGESRDLGPGTR